MSHPRDLPARPSLDSLRKQAKRLARDAAAGDPTALARAEAQFPSIALPLSARDAQLVVAREYGFVGWHDLIGEVAKRLGDGLDWAASRARAAIHDEDHEQLRALLDEHPGLIAWRGENGQTLLDATTSYAMDASDPERERTYTRPVAAEMLLDAGATVDAAARDNIINAAAGGMLQLLVRKGALPITLSVAAALGDAEAVSDALREPHEQTLIARPFLIACRFKHVDVARQLLDAAIALDPETGQRIERWRPGNGRAAFVEFLMQQPSLLYQAPMTPWQTFVTLQLDSARARGDLAAFERWLDDEPWILGDAFVDVQMTLMLPACYEKDREAFIGALLHRGPAVLRRKTPPTARRWLIGQALSYGNAHLVPLLTRIWPLPDDLPHAAGTGDAAGVARWFDANGDPKLGPLAQHYPHSDPTFARDDLHWGPPTVQQVLDVALAWAVLNRQFAIASLLLDRGANIDADWGTHEPASILHEAAIQGNEPAVRFLIAHGADLTKRDYR